MAMENPTWGYTRLVGFRYMNRGNLKVLRGAASDMRSELSHHFAEQGAQPSNTPGSLRVAGDHADPLAARERPDRRDLQTWRHHAGDGNGGSEIVSPAPLWQRDRTTVAR